MRRVTYPRDVESRSGEFGHQAFNVGLVEDRFAVAQLPTVPLPLEDPFSCTTDGELAVRHNLDALHARFVRLFQCLYASLCVKKGYKLLLKT